MDGHHRPTGYQIEDSVEVRVPASGGESAGRHAILNALSGMGFIECVTHSLVSVEAANQFLLKGQSPLVIDDDRAAAEPALRPSLIPSLLTVRKLNDDNGVKHLRLAELGSVFAVEHESHSELTELALLIDSHDDDGIGELRGIVNRVCSILAASDDIVITPNDDAGWLEPGGVISVNNKTIGRIGRLCSSAQEHWDIPNTLHVAQLHLGALLESFPPELQSRPLPTQPAIDRDISVIIDESVLWSDVTTSITSLNLDHLKDILYVTTFRGKGIESGKKSLTLRLRFRDLKRTLTHEEVNNPMTRAIETLAHSLNAEIRT